MSEPIEPLPPDIAALLQRERDAYPDDPGLKDAVRARVERSIALGAPSPGTTPPKPDVQAAVEAAKRAIWAKLVAATVSAFVLGGVVGGAVVKGVSSPASPDPKPTPSALATAPPLPSAPPSTLASIAPPPSAPASTPAASSATAIASAPASAIPSGAQGDLTRERELLDAARAALGQGHPDDALAAAQKHAERWPHGYLVEEREVIAIQALVAAGRRDEAERRGAAFRKAFPKSMLMPAVDAALSP